MKRIVLLFCLAGLLALSGPAGAVSFQPAAGQMIAGGFAGNESVTASDWSPIGGLSLYLGIGEANFVVSVLQEFALNTDTEEPLVTVGALGYVLVGAPEKTSLHAALGMVLQRDYEPERISHGGGQVALGVDLPLGDRSYHSIEIFGRWVETIGWSGGVSECIRFDFP